MTGGGDSRSQHGRRLHGVEAVIDKDLAAALLASGLEADALLLLTDVANLVSAWQTPHARPLREVSAAELREMEFAPGSMGPRWRRRAGSRSALEVSPRSARSPMPWRFSAARGAPEFTASAERGARPERSTWRSDRVDERLAPSPRPIELSLGQRTLGVLDEEALRVGDHLISAPP
jgi:hypothetical protein